MKCKQTSDYYFFRQLILILLTSFLLVQPVFSASVNKLYEASVKADSDKGENQLIREAFTHVLIKVSGRSNVSASPSYSAMMKKAEGAISQFRYDYKTIPIDELNADDASAQNEQNGAQKQEKEKWFWVRFNAKTVNDLLKEVQLPVWGKIRPETLIWFSQETGGKRFLQSQHDEPEIYAVFKQQAEQRGISLIFPFMDLQDQSSVSAADIWGNFNDAVLLASRRYQAQSTLTSRVYKEPSGLWVTQWNLLMLGEVQSWEIRNKNLPQALTSGIDELANKLSRQFTQIIRDDGDSGILVQINNVGDFKAFQEVDDYLGNLATVKSISLMQMEQDRLIYSINYLNNKNSMIQEIRLGDLLNPVERSRVDSEQYDTNYGDSKYSPVILDDLGEKNTGQNESQLSERERALSSLNAPQSKDPYDKANAAASPQTTMPQMVQEKTVEKLIPELEYWLAR